MKAATVEIETGSQELSAEEREEIRQFAEEHPELTAGQIFLHYERQCMRCLGPAHLLEHRSESRGSFLGFEIACTDSGCLLRLSYAQVAEIAER